MLPIKNPLYISKLFKIKSLKHLALDDYKRIQNTHIAGILQHLLTSYQIWHSLLAPVSNYWAKLRRGSSDFQISGQPVMKRINITTEPVMILT